MTSFSLPGALEVLVREMRMAEDDARRALEEIQCQLAALFADHPWNQALMARITTFLAESYPPPDGYRWGVSYMGAGTVYVRLDQCEDVPGGYVFAARVTVGYDGGGHAVKGDLWKHQECSGLILPDDKDAHDRWHATLLR